MALGSMNIFGNSTKINRNKLLEIFSVLNTRLKENNLYMELTLYGDSLMSLLYDIRPATKDIDCIFTVTDFKLLDNIIKDIGFLYNLPNNWFNDDIKEPIKILLKENLKTKFNYSNLKIIPPDKEQLLAMKILSARPEPAKDFIDAYLLCKDLDIRTKEQLMTIVKTYLPISILGERQILFIKYLGSDLGYVWE
mgnify:CR=1 FL=1